MNLDRIKILQAFIKESPDDPFNHYALALELMTEEPAQACQILLDLVKRKPDYLPAYYQLALLLIDENRFEEAKVVLDNGIVLGRKQNDHKTIRELKTLLQELE
ncbi:MAG TPA: tetratricopeptide repeat protein [Cyclobacteriaceae bacterium]|nr:tetratricopeptide repeat protein [Cyclobacteriaceae bacterium]